MTDLELDVIFAHLEVGEVCGIGRRSTAKLQGIGISSVLELKRTVAELNGVACLELDDVIPDKQQIICSRSFGSLVSNLTDLEQAVVAYVTRAAEKLRRQHSIEGGIQVYTRTNPHKEKYPQYQPSILIPLFEPTDDTRLLCRAALQG
jgi:DNA polymerase V